MLSLRNRFGIPGVISVIALVFAMLGGAYAASNDGGQGKATASAKKGPRGPRGPKGPAGPAGPQGPAGPAGAKGDTGAKGDPGQNGTNGTNGVSVTSATLPAGDANCEYGGSKFTAASGATYACNGEPGEEGPEGSPWTAGGTLPSKKTETGTWAFGPVPADHGQATVPISFFLPLSAALTYPGNIASCDVAAPNQPATCQVHYIDATGKEVTGEEVTKTSTYCKGNAAAPTAAPGHLCIYAETEANVLTASFLIVQAGDEFVGASTAGAVVTFYLLGTGSARGTYAVTAP